MATYRLTCRRYSRAAGLRGSIWAIRYRNVGKSEFKVKKVVKNLPQRKPDISLEKSQSKPGRGPCLLPVDWARYLKVLQLACRDCRRCSCLCSMRKLGEGLNASFRCARLARAEVIITFAWLFFALSVAIRLRSKADESVIINRR